MNSYSIALLAYLKVVLHAAKYPASTVAGLLIGTTSPSGTTIVDAIPLLHHWSEMSMAMELGLQLAEVYVKQQQWSILGLYVGNERLGDTSVPHGLGRAAEAIRKERPEALVLVIDNERLASGETALIPYLFDAAAASWRSFTLPAAQVSLADARSAVAALDQVKAKRHVALGDLDEHLENAKVDWLRNAAVTV
ncbi:hypothetical protein JCM11641_005590 [Rhodosporidiobolus odoratus]